MKALVVILGLVIGIFLGGAVLLLNPITLTHSGPAGLKGAIQTIGWESGGGFRGLDLTPTALLGGGTDGPSDFQEPGIRYARAEIVVLTAEAGAPPGLGVRLSAVARHNSLLKAQLGIVTAWNIVWPGRGTVLLAGSENFWSPLRDGLWSAVRGRGFRPAAERYPLPPVPGLGAPLLMTGTGQFAGAKGGFREDFSPSADAAAGFTGLRTLDLAIE